MARVESGSGRGSTSRESNNFSQGRGSDAKTMTKTGPASGRTGPSSPLKSGGINRAVKGN